MGLSLFKSCSSGYSYNAPAPNPDPGRWYLLYKYEYKNAYVLIVKYLDCTNFEGIKCMVYKGKYKNKMMLDPHFTDDPDSPIARFRPDAEGIKMAQDLANSIKGSK